MMALQADVERLLHLDGVERQLADFRKDFGERFPHIADRFEHELSNLRTDLDSTAKETRQRNRNAGVPADNDERASSGAGLLDELPGELLELIVLCLPVAAVVALGACCVRLRCLTSSDAVWRRLYEAAFPRGRTSLGGLACWRDVYRRAVLSVPSSTNANDAVRIFEFADKSSLPRCVAFDHVRQQVISIDMQEMRATGMDGVTVRTANSVDGAVHLFADRTTGNYIAVSIADGRIRVHLLDSNFREIQPSADVSKALIVFLAAFRPNGRLFCLVGWGADYDVLSVDPVAGSVCRLPSTTEQKNLAYDAVADERDCLVIATMTNDLITIDSDGNQVAALPIKCGQVAISRDGIVAVLLTGSNRQEVHFFASNTVESPPIGRYVLPPSHSTRYIMHMVWTDECLLVCF
eukprot:TRINITY_DN787_c1_g2_i6.p1 TRINITY_DN787_c1_g2~~TRINITY_DN787_c1_g2_i6.p1  ORF type:complete len:408 (-),score=99.51 TRINITY_DN787_c1_g2_i6:171-1394(-)